MKIRKIRKIRKTPDKFKKKPKPNQTNVYQGSVLGFRTWIVENGLLKAAGVKEAWPSSEMEAVCVAGKITGSLIHTPGHQAPQKDCTCGIYANHSFYLARHNAKTWRLPIVGAVAGAGRMEIHADGYRCQKAQILAFYVVSSKWFRDKPQELEKIQSTYQVPVFFSKKKFLNFVKKKTQKIPPSLVPSRKKTQWNNASLLWFLTAPYYTIKKHWKMLIKSISVFLVAFLLLKATPLGHGLIFLTVEKITLLPLMIFLPLVLLLLMIRLPAKIINHATVSNFLLAVWLSFTLLLSGGLILYAPQKEQKNTLEKYGLKETLLPKKLSPVSLNTFNADSENEREIKAYSRDNNQLRKVEQPVSYRDNSQSITLAPYWNLDKGLLFNSRSYDGVYLQESDGNIEDLSFEQALEDERVLKAGGPIFSEAALYMQGGYPLNSNFFDFDIPHQKSILQLMQDEQGEKYWTSMIIEEEGDDPSLLMTHSQTGETQHAVSTSINPSPFYPDSFYIRNFQIQSIKEPSTEELENKLKRKNQEIKSLKEKITQSSKGDSRASSAPFNLDSLLDQLDFSRLSEAP